ncbi:MAG: response regulator transcription factor [Bacteroidia bacterium]|nr:response regulator transcription factor [Bacteroidia bacterium]
MKKTILLYGLLMAALVWLLKYLDYRFLVRDISMEIYMGLIASLFTGVGIWMGLKLTRPKVAVPPAVMEKFTPQADRLETLGISPREYEVLELLAQGLSNQEIADKLFVSLNTVKTHTSNLFTKLEARRRTQAVQRAKELGVLP